MWYLKNVRVFIGPPCILLAQLLSFKRPLLSVNVPVCLSVCRQLWCQISRKL